MKANFEMLKGISYFVYLLLLLFFVIQPGYSTTYYSTDTEPYYFSTTNLWSENTGGGAPFYTASDPDQSDHNFVIQNGHTVILDKSYDVDSLTVESGGTFNLTSSGYALLIWGELTLSGTLNEGNATIDLRINEDTDLNINGNYYIYNLVITGLTAGPPKTVTLLGDGSPGAETLTITNEFKLTDRAAFSRTLSGSYESAIAYSSAKLNYNYGTNSYDTGDEWPQSLVPDDVDITSGTVTLVLSRSVDNLDLIGGDFQIGTGGALTINSGGVLTLQGSRTFTINSGLTLTINGTLDMNGGELVNNGTLAYSTSSSTLRYSATSTQYTDIDEWSTSTTAGEYPHAVSITNTNNVIISDNGTSTVATTPRRTDNLTLLGGELRHGNILTINGDVTASTGSYGVTDTGTMSAVGTSSELVASGSLTLYQLSFSSTNGILNGITINDLFTKSGSGSVQLSGGLTLANGADIAVTGGTLDLNGQTVTKGGSNTLTLSNSSVLQTGGTNLSNFTLDITGGTVEFNGSAAETTPSGATFGNLTMNNPGGLNINGSVTVNGVIAFSQDGTINTNASNTLTLGISASFSGQSSSRYVNGPLGITVDDSEDQIFPIGTSNVYRPAVFNWTSTSPGTDVLQMQYLESAPGGDPGLIDGITEISSAGHYTLQITSGSYDGGYDITLDATDPGYTPFDRHKILVQNGSGPIYDFPDNDTYSNPNVTATASELPKVNYRLAFGKGGTATTITWDGGGDGSTWGSANNWVPDGVPSATDDVEIDNAAGVSVTISSSTSAQAASLTLGDGSGSTVTLNITSTSLTPLTVSGALTLDSEGSLVFSAANGDISAGSLLFDAASDVEYQSRTIPAAAYGNLTINNATGTAGDITVAGDLEKDGGIFNSSNSISVSGDYANTAGNATYSGGLTVTGTTTLTSGTVAGTISLTGSSIVIGTGSFGGTVTFTGGNTQILSGNSASFVNLVINKTSDQVEIGSNGATVSGTLLLSNGLINTESGLLTLATGTDGNNNSYIYGPVAIQNATGSKTFPVGKSYYRPVISNLTGSSPVVQFEVYDSPPTYNFNFPLLNISSVRYWIGGINTGSISGGSITLYYGSDDGVIDFDEQGDVVVARASVSGGPYLTLGGQTSGSAPEGSVTSTTSVGSSLDYFTLGATTGDNPLPVELAAFEALADFSKIELTWTTASENNNLGFNVYKTTAEEDSWNKVNLSLIEGQGTVSYASDYSFVDSKIIAGETYRYKLESVSVNGLAIEEKVVEVTVPIPDQYALFNNYPNPFNPTTNIKFQLPEAQQIRLAIYDLNGSLIRTLTNNKLYPSGEHIVSWNATDNAGNRVATGIYLYRFQAGKFVKTGKMILVK